METAKPHAACVRNLGACAGKTDPGLNFPEYTNFLRSVWVYSGHVINPPQDVHHLPGMPSQFNVVVVCKEDAAGSYKDLR